MKTTKTLIIFLLISVVFLSNTSCSRKLLSPTILSYKEYIFKTEGIKVTGVSTGYKFQKAAIKEATENALKNAGPDYDILSDVEIRVKMGLLSTKFIVTGTAHKSKDILK